MQLMKEEYDNENDRNSLVGPICLNTTKKPIKSIHIDMGNKCTASLTSLMYLCTLLPHRLINAQNPIY